MLKDDSLSNNSKLFLIKNFDAVLSLDLLKIEDVVISEELKDKIEKLINERNNAKNNKDYDKADQIREELLSLGVVIKDGREGTTYTIKEVK